MNRALQHILICQLTALMLSVTLNAQQLHLLSDRSIYLSGETLSYALHLDQSSNIEFFRVYLQDGSGKLIDQHIHRLPEQKAWGAFKLGEYLDGGGYRLVTDKVDGSGQTKVLASLAFSLVNPYEEDMKLIEGEADHSNPIQVHGPRESVSFRLDSAGLQEAGGSCAVSIVRSGSEGRVCSVAFEDDPGVHAGSECRSFQGRYDGDPGMAEALYLVLENGELARSVPDREGRFGFLLGSGVEGAQGAAIYALPGDKDARIELAADPKSTEEMDIPMQLADSVQRQLLDRMFVTLQVKQRFVPEPQNEVARPSVPFYIHPDSYIELKDYVKLPNMEEVLREIVPGVLVLGSQKMRSIHVVDLESNRTLGDHPCLLIDGYPSTAEELFSLDPSVVVSVEVVKSSFILGDWVMDGILALRTLGVQKQGKKAVLEEQLHFPEEAFKPGTGPLYTGSSRIPDLRNTLFWEPDLRPGPEGILQIEFITPDDPGNYTIVVTRILPRGAERSLYSFRVEL